MAGENLSNNPAFIVAKKNFALGSLKMNTSSTGDLTASVVKQKTPSADSTLKLTVTGNSKDGIDKLDTDVSINIPSSITKNLIKPTAQNANLNFVTVVYKNGDMLGSDGNDQRQNAAGW